MTMKLFFIIIYLFHFLLWVTFRLFYIHIIISIFKLSIISKYIEAVWE